MFLTLLAFTAAPASLFEERRRNKGVILS
uniref:Uncharacterized protein n=1 Tax=Anguilla anguilla TaxID=7936 RepID=A0A0E9PHQ0_ANGAN